MHYLPDGTPAPGWPAGGASLLAGISGPSGYVLAPHEDGRLTIGWSEPLDIYSFAYRARLRWILPDGTIDPDQPDSGLALGGAPNTGPLAIIRNGSGGVYVLRSERIPDYLEPAKLWLSQVEQQHNVDVPRPASGGALVLSAVQPNPATGPATVRFRLPGDVPRGWRWWTSPDG
jgi:hypothetical protein